MFARKPRTEIIIRVLLTAVILFSASPNSFTAKAAEEIVTPTETVTHIPTTQPISVPTETPTTEIVTPVGSAPVAGTPVPASTLIPSDATNTVPNLRLSAAPSFITPGGNVVLNWEIEGVARDGLTLHIILPDGFPFARSPKGAYMRIPVVPCH